MELKLTEHVHDVGNTISLLYKQQTNQPTKQTKNKNKNKNKTTTKSEIFPICGTFLAEKKN